MPSKRPYLIFPRRALSFFLVLLPALGMAQTAASVLQVRRIAATADLSVMTRLTGHRPGWAQPANDAGAVPDDSQIHLQVLLARAPQVQAAFEQRLTDQQNLSSSNYHRWLTPTQIGQLYGPVADDLAAVTSWLSVQGLHVDGVAPSGIFIQVSGPAAIVESTFQTALHTYRRPSATGADVTRSWRAPTQEPAIPAAFTPVVSAIQGLTDVPVEPQLLHAGAEPQPEPHFTATSGGHFISPGDFATIYDLTPVYNAGINGAGYRVAIIGLSQVNPVDISTYQAIFSLPSKTLNVVVPPLGADPGQTANSDQSEATLDVERVIGTAPGSQPDLVISSPATGGLITAISYNVQTLLDPIMTISFGACEVDAGRAETTFYANLFAQGAAEGISTFVSAGDSGAASCDTHGAAPPVSQILSINAYCASGFVTCVGGTEFNDTTNAGSYWNASNSNRTSATGYIPEGVWNDTTTSTGAFTILAGGGGSSIYYPKPAFQSGTGVPADGARDVPDVSFSASLHDAYIYCYKNAGSGPCTLDPNTNAISFSSNGGTSAAAPSMAGIAALIDQKLGGPQGSLNPLIYRVANRAYSTAFHDLTVASSGVVDCTVTTPSLCNNSTPGPTDPTKGQSGYLLTAGFDLASGWGSLDVANFLAAAGTAGAASAATLTGSSGTITGAQTLTFNVAVTPAAISTVIPTGNVQFYVNGAPSGQAVTLDPTGKAVYTVSSSAFAFGSELITATYSGDTNYEGSTSNALQLTLNPSGTAASTLTLAASSNPVDPTQTVTLTATFAGNGTNAPTGLITIAAVDGGLLYRLVSQTVGSGHVTDTFSGLVAGSHKYQATYTGDPFYGPNSSNVLSVVSNALPTATSLTGPATASSTSATSFTVTVTGLYTNVSTQGLAVVQLFDGATQIAALKPTPAASSSATTTGTATFNIALAPGSHTLTAEYPGDFYSASSTSAALITVSAAPGITVTPASASLTTSAGGSVTDGLTVNSVGGYSGSAGLTCAVSFSGTLTINALPTCILSPAFVTVAAAGPASSTLTISTTAPHAAMRAGLQGRSLLVRSSAAPLLATLFCCLPLMTLRRRSRVRHLLLLIACAVGVLLLSSVGCGGGSSSTQVPGTTAATYTVTISGGPGTSSAVLDTISVTVQ